MFIKVGIMSKSLINKNAEGVHSTKLPLSGPYMSGHRITWAILDMFS